MTATFKRNPVRKKKNKKKQKKLVGEHLKLDTPFRTLPSSPNIGSRGVAFSKKTGYSFIDKFFVSEHSNIVELAIFLRPLFAKGL